MNVPNENKVTFREMTAEERSAIVDAKVLGEVERYWGDGEWRCSDDASVVFSCIYRTKPRQLIIPWDVIKPEYKWAAMNDDEAVWLYDRKPEIYMDERWAIMGCCSPSVLNIDTTGIDWRESLVQRPEGV